jgi:hypothetical protein
MSQDGDLPRGVDETYMLKHGITPPLRNFKRKYGRQRVRSTLSCHTHLSP